MKHTNSLFLKYMATYMLVCIVVISVFGIFLYQTSVSGQRKTAIGEYQSALAESRSLIDSELTKIYDISVVLQSRRDTESLRRLQRPITGQSIPALSAYSKELRPYCYTNGFVSNLILYFDQSSLLVSTDGAGIYPEIFYHVVLGYPESFAEWQQWAEEDSFLRFRFYEESSPGQSYVDIYQRLPSSRSVLMIARVETEKILAEFGSLGGVVAVVAPDGRLLAASDGFLTEIGSFEQFLGLVPGSTVTLNGESYTVFSEDAQNIGWKYLLFVPESSVFAEERQMLLTIVMLTAAILLAGLLMSAAFSMYNVTPVRRLLHSFSSYLTPRSDGNEYKRLNEGIEQLVENNRALRGEIDRRIQNNRTSFAEKLVRGDFSSTEELRATAGYADIDLEAKGWIPLLFGILGYNSETALPFMQEIDVTSTVAEDYLRRNMTEDTLLCKPEIDRVAVILRLPANGGQAPEDQALSLIEGLRRECGLGLCCAIGSAVEDLSMIGAVFYTLERALDARGAENSAPLISVKGESLIGESFHYPLNVESSLLNYLLSGNEKEACSTLRLLFEQNREYHVTMPAAAYFLQAVKCTFIRARSGISLDKEAAHRFDYMIYLVKHHDLEAQLRDFEEICSLLCGAIRERNEHKNDRLVSAVGEFIRENYADDRLGLSMIASHFQLTENYLSYFYKKQTGENLSAVIERERLRRAAALMESENKTLREIASEVGYQNLNTFYKAFKRCFGMPPSAYLEEYRKQKAGRR